MSKLEDFKTFVRDNPKLINYVKNDSMSWQNFMKCMIYTEVITKYGIVI